MLGPEYTALIALEAEAEVGALVRPGALVPGLLQTEEYARAVISSGLLIAPPGEIERRVQVKMTRQKVLARDDPLTLDVILDEAAVLRMVGGPKVMRGQLAHLAAMAGRPNVTVQVLPLASRGSSRDDWGVHHPGVPGPGRPGRGVPGEHDQRPVRRAGSRGVPLRHGL